MKKNKISYFYIDYNDANLSIMNAEVCEFGRANYSDYIVLGLTDKDNKMHYLKYNFNHNYKIRRGNVWLFIKFDTNKDLQKFITDLLDDEINNYNISESMINSLKKE